MYRQSGYSYLIPRAFPKYLFFIKISFAQTLTLAACPSYQSFSNLNIRSIERKNSQFFPPFNAVLWNKNIGKYYVAFQKCTFFF